MLKKITFAALFIIFGISVYFIFIFDINDYKSDGLEKSRVQLLSKNYKLPKWTS